MAITDEQRMRERFEDWGRTYHLNLIRTRGGQYQDVPTEVAYAAWRASNAEVQVLREALTEVTEDLASEIIAKHGPIQAHPDAVRSFDQEMEPVRRARKLLAGGEKENPNE